MHTRKIRRVSSLSREGEKSYACFTELYLTLRSLFLSLARVRSSRKLRSRRYSREKNFKGARGFAAAKRVWVSFLSRKDGQCTVEILCANRRPTMRI